MSSEPNRAIVHLFTDGACINNPGRGGWAYILKHVASGRSKEGSGGEPATTNNRMEITAVIRGIEALRLPSSVRVFSDSEYVVNAVNEWMAKWKSCGWRKSPKAKECVKNDDLWRRLHEVMSPHTIVAEWVRGHSGHPENERCDQLAMAQALAQKKAPP